METNVDLFGEIIEELYVDVPIEDEFEDNDDYDEGYDDYCCGGYEWTAEDSWDALTDGMYGDMPSSPWEYDAMMDAMGY